MKNFMKTNYTRKKEAFYKNIYQKQESLWNQTIPEIRKIIKSNSTRGKDIYGTKLYWKNANL